MLPTLLFIVVLVVAVTDWVAVAKGWRKIEIIAKPATMMLLFGYLALAGGFGATPLICFGLGILFSLAGDVFLLFASTRWFLFGLVAFLLAQVAYILGLNIPLGEPSSLWAIGIGIVLAMTTGRILRRILAGVREKGQPRLVVPIVIYGTVITLMVLSAILIIYRVDWKTSASGLVSVGAILFYSSDMILAWNKFVKPVRNGRLMNMIAYHLGQIALIAGIVLQFAN
jgi:uncharacterized membrane protein YhhN